MQAPSASECKFLLDITVAEFMHCLIVGLSWPLTVGLSARCRWTVDYVCRQPDMKFVLRMLTLHCNCVNVYTAMVTLHRAVKCPGVVFEPGAHKLKIIHCMHVELR